MSPLHDDERRLLEAMLDLGERDGDYLMGAGVAARQADLRQTRARDLLNELVIRALVRRWHSADDGLLYGVQREAALAALGAFLLPVSRDPRIRLSALAERVLCTA